MAVVAVMDMLVVLAAAGALDHVMGFGVGGAESMNCVQTVVGTPLRLLSCTRQTWHMLISTLE